MTDVFVKDPAAIIDFTVDWNDGYLANGETISASSWPTIDPAAGVVVDLASATTTTATAKISGGVAGTVVRLVNRIVTSLGRTDERTVTVLIADR